MSLHKVTTTASGSPSIATSDPATTSTKVKKESDLRLLAVTCLLLASKYDELDEKIPFVRDLLTLYQADLLGVDHADVLRLESQIVFKFDFELMILTPIHFTYALIAQGVVFLDSDSLSNTKENTENSSTTDNTSNSHISDKVLSNIRKYAEFFTDLATHCITQITNLYYSLRVKEVQVLPSSPSCHSLRQEDQ